MSLAATLGHDFTGLGHRQFSEVRTDVTEENCGPLPPTQFLLGLRPGEAYVLLSSTTPSAANRSAPWLSRRAISVATQRTYFGIPASRAARLRLMSGRSAKALATAA
jgi:hypothetical protein